MRRRNVRMVYSEANGSVDGGSRRMPPWRSDRLGKRTSLGLAAIALMSVLTPFPLGAAEKSEVPAVEYDVRELTYPELAEFEVPEAERVELKNGLVIYLIEDHELPQIKASARIATGSVYEPADHIGLASIVGRALRSGGTETMAPDAVNQALEGVGATVETSIGRASGSAYMSSLAEEIDTVLPIFAEVLMKPRFAKEKLALAKSREKSAISRRNDDPHQVAMREFRQLIYGEESPYARVPEYYTIEAISRKDVVSFYRQYFHPNNMLLGVWGDFETAKMVKRLKEQFGDWAPDSDFERPTPPEPDFKRGKSVNLVVKKDVTQSNVLIGHPAALKRNDSDYIPVTIMNEVLSGGFSGRLFENVRSKQGLAYSVFGQYTAHYRRPGYFYAGVATKSGSTVKAIRSVLREIRKLRESAPTEDEVALAKESYLSSFVFNFDSQREIVSRIITYDYFDYPRDFLRQFRAGIEGVGVSDVHRVAQEYLRPDTMKILVVGNPADFSQSLSALGEVQQVDISIPSMPPGATAEQDTSGETEASVAAGAKALAAARETLGGASFDGITNMTFRSKRAIRTSAGEMKLEAESVIAGVDRLWVKQETPHGEMTITLRGEQASIQTGQGEKSLPASQVRQIRAQLWRNLTFLLRHHEHPELKAIDRGAVKIKGRTLRKIEVRPPEGKPFELYLDPKTGRPVRLAFERTTRQGDVVPAAKVFGDFREVDGIRVPYRVTVYQDGEEREEVTRRDVRFNRNLKGAPFESTDD